jgi:uncharacterized protein (DUF2336 family)
MVRFPSSHSEVWKIGFTPPNVKAAEFAPALRAFLHAPAIMPAKIMANRRSFRMQPTQILELARSRTPEDRERLLLALVDLCAVKSRDGEGDDPAVQHLMSSVFLSLVADAEQQIRQALALRLAGAAWAPHALVNVLALDEIEIARPIIAQSPVLEDGDLIRILALATLEHQIAVAGRPALGESIVERLLESADPAVLAALAANDTARISQSGMERLLEASRDLASVRSPLVRHPNLTPDMAERLYAWVGQSLRSAIVSRFRVDAEELDREIAEAVRTSHDGTTPTEAERAPIMAAANEDRIEMERKLIDKLQSSGQLRPGFLVKALRDQRLSLFVTGLARKIDVEREIVQRAIDSDQPQLLALACVSAGIDRSVYDTVLRLVRELNGGRPHGGAEDGRRAMAAFGVQDLAKARAVLQQTASA